MEETRGGEELRTPRAKWLHQIHRRSAAGSKRPGRMVYSSLGNFLSGSSPLFLGVKQVSPFLAVRKDEVLLLPSSKRR
jgi:hypothetical protein